MRTRPPRPTLASVTSDGVRFEVNRVVSGDDDGFTIVYWTLTNTREGELSLPEFFQDIRVEYGDLAYFQDEYPWYLAETLLVEVHLPDRNEFYPPLTDSGSNCLCGVWASETRELSAGKSIQTYSAYYLPPDTETIAVDFPGVNRLLKNIPVKSMTSGASGKGR